jgi:membrane-associated phospholipid phosphatase
LAALLWVGIAAFSSPAFTSFELEGLEDFGWLFSPRVYNAALDVVRIGEPLPFAVAVVALLTVALVRRRVSVALTVAASSLAAVGTTQVLQQVATGKRFPSHLGENLWPSGHTTAAAALAVALVFVTPAVVRPLVVALAGVGLLVVSYSILMLHTHHPSDELAAMLVVANWTALATAWLRSRPSDIASVPRRTATLAAGALAAIAGALGLGVLVASTDAGAHIGHPWRFGAVALVVGASAIALPVGAALGAARLG